MVVGTQLSEQAFPSFVITSEFLLEGEIRVKGVVQVTINNEEKETMTLHNVHAQALYTQNVAAQMDTDELVLMRKHCQIIAFPEAFSQENYQLRSGRRQALVYTPRFAVQGGLPMGPDDRFSDAYEDLKEFFLPLLDAQIYPLYPIRPTLPREFAMVLVYREMVEMMQERA